MSTVMEGIDARGYLGGWLQGLVGMYSADINALPEDKWAATFGGCTRTAQDLTADAIALLEWCTEALKGKVGEMTKETYASVATEIPTRESAIARLTEAAGAFNAALKAASDEDLNKVVMPPWQMEAPLYMLAQIAVSHVWYHDGQLNYIQCLLGDDKVHWMGD
jgi:hypothetical protein